jgi:hypothetical protein
MAGDVILKNVALILLSMFLVAVFLNVPASRYDDDIDDAYKTMTPIMSIKGTVKTSDVQSPVIMEKVRMTKEEIEKLEKR